MSKLPMEYQDPGLSEFQFFSYKVVGSISFKLTFGIVIL